MNSNSLIISFFDGYDACQRTEVFKSLTEDVSGEEKQYFFNNHKITQDVYDKINHFISIQKSCEVLYIN